MSKTFLIVTVMPYVMSLISLVSIWMAGKKIRANWLVGLGNQGLWFLWIFTTQSWGMLILTIGLTYLCARNWVLWGRSDPVRADDV